MSLEYPRVHIQFVLLLLQTQQSLQLPLKSWSLEYHQPPPLLHQHLGHSKSESDHNSSQNSDMKKKTKTVTMPNKCSQKKESENNIEGKQGKQPLVLSWVKRKLSPEKEANAEKYIETTPYRE